MERERYDYHLGVFSKLLRGWKSTNPIKPGTEARIVSRSRNWGPGGNEGGNQLDLLCDPVSYFDGSPEVLSMDARLLRGGTFLYRPFVRGDGSRHHSVFARIEARSEGGEGQPGRRYTHCAALIVDDHWEPGLIPWAATMLFDPDWSDEEGFAYGAPIPENHKTRFERALPDLCRDALSEFEGPSELSDWPLGMRSGDGLTLQAALPDTADLAHPQLALARRLATVLRERDLAVHGRWLSFAFGIASNVDGPGVGYTIRLDDRSPDDPPRGVQIPFSDSDPPLPVETDLIRDASAQLSASAVYSVRRLPRPPRAEASGQKPGMAKARFFTTKQLWPDQGGEGDAPSVAPADETGGTRAGRMRPGQAWSVEEGPPDEAEIREVLKPAPHGFPESAAGAVRHELRVGVAARGPDPAMGADRDQADTSDPVTRDVRFVLAEDKVRRPHGATRPVVASAAARLRPDAATDDQGRAGATPEGHDLPRRPGEHDVRADAPSEPAAAQIAIDWPILPDKKHHWVLEPDLLSSVHKRIAVFIDLLGLLDTGDFREFARFDGLTREDKITEDLSEISPLFFEAFAQVVHIICIYATTGKPMRLLDPLSVLLAHDAKPGIGLRAASTGSLNALIVRSLIEEGIGLEQVHLYISRQSRIARDMVAIGGYGPANLVAPRSGDFEDLLDALAPEAELQTLWGKSPPGVLAELDRVVEEVYDAALRKLVPVFA